MYPAAEEPLLLRAEFQDGTITWTGKQELVKYRKKIKRSFHCVLRQNKRSMKAVRRPAA